jgi:GNAT superfamily N-acetyltransferase
MHLPDFLKEDWMKEIKIRPAHPTELPRILSIILRAYKPIEPLLGRKPRGLLETEEKLRQRLEKGHLYTVLLGKKVVGTFTIAPNKQHQLMEIQKVAILPEKQNHGLGTYIMESAEHLLRLKKERQVIIETYQDHRQLVDFYLHRGYKIIGERMSKGNVVLLMRKNLWRED